VIAFIPAAQNYALSASADKATLFTQSKTDLFSWVKAATVMTIGVRPCSCACAPLHGFLARLMFLATRSRH
jgi:hypothetical protein